MHLVDPILVLVLVFGEREPRRAGIGIDGPINHLHVRAGRAERHQVAGLVGVRRVPVVVVKTQLVVVLFGDGRFIVDPLIERRLLSATDPKTGMNVTLAPPPNTTSFVENSNRQMTFPPRFGEHNAEFYGRLGYTDAQMAELKSDGVI